MTIEQLIQSCITAASARHTRAVYEAAEAGVPPHFYKPASKLHNYIQFLQDELVEYREGQFVPPSFDYEAFRLASQYAARMSGCNKVVVGCLIGYTDGSVSLGANVAAPDRCNTHGCQRVELYGDDSKNHRNPEDCRACHSEIDALAQGTRSAQGAAVYVTRYPCEACARALASAKVHTVHYGRNQPISDQTISIFEAAGIEWNMHSWWNEEDTTR